jgi:2-keto-4-pentenoate hydratase/2-oxohepta-3-ene-1,7-dioic acid hydratase in catechol pathway
MKIGRCLFRNKEYYCVVEEKKLRLLSLPPFDGIVYSGEIIQADETRLLAPVQPSKIVAIGLNYKAHAREFGKPMPDEPLIFIKPPTSVIGDGDNIVYPEMSKRVDYEGELAVVIGRKAKNIGVEQAQEFILGYTIMNDVTARDLQAKDGQYTRAKGFDTFAPIGPWIETDIKPDNLYIKTYLNGIMKQNGNTSDMQFSVYQIISFISKVMTLLPGDVISAGTPPGIGPMNKGDLIEVDIQGIGRLRNRLI